MTNAEKKAQKKAEREAAEKNGTPTVDRDGVDTGLDTGDPPPDAPEVKEDPKVALRREVANWEEQTKLIADLETDRHETETKIAHALVAIGAGSRSQPTIKLGGVPHKARRSKDKGEAPKLVKLADVTSIDLD